MTVGDIDDNGGGDGDIDNVASVTATELGEPQNALADVEIARGSLTIVKQTDTCGVKSSFEFSVGVGEVSRRSRSR